VGAAAATVRGSRDLHGQYADVGWQRRIFDHHVIYKCKQALAGVYYAMILSWNCFDWNSPRWTYCYIKKLLSSCCDLAHVHSGLNELTEDVQKKETECSRPIRLTPIQEETSGFLKEQLQKQRLRPTGRRKKQTVECIDLKVNAKIGSINLKISSATRDITAFYYILKASVPVFSASLRICKWMLIWLLSILKIRILFLCTRI